VTFDIKFFFVVIGMVMIIEGIPYFTMPDKVKYVAGLISNSRRRALRIIGLSLMLFGLAMVSFGRL